MNHLVETLERRDCLSLAEKAAHFDLLDPTRIEAGKPAPAKREPYKKRAAI